MDYKENRFSLLLSFTPSPNLFVFLCWLDIWSVGCIFRDGQFIFPGSDRRLFFFFNLKSLNFFQIKRYWSMEWNHWTIGNTTIWNTNHTLPKKKRRKMNILILCIHVYFDD
jgi:hypothetical protein